MKVGIDLSQHQHTWDELADRARFADDAGFDSGWVFDHFQPLSGAPGGPCLEGWTLLAALAALTRRIRLGALVTGVTYRHPSVLAAEAVTVDHVSGGRLDIGMGAAWHEPEHRQLGIPFPSARERTERLEEAIQVMRALMTQDGASFAGHYYQLANATYHPRPVQRPHPPIWIGASGERLMLPLVARQADVWHAFGDPDTLARKSAIIDEHARRAGRDPRSIVRSTTVSLSQSRDQIQRTAERLAGLGFGYLVASWPSEGRAHLEDFAAHVLPTITHL